MALSPAGQLCRRSSSVALLLVLAACAAEPASDIVTVAATKHLLGATVVLDGVAVGRLEYLQTHGTWFEALMKRLYPDSPLHETVALNISLDPSRMSRGLHEARLEQPNGAPLVGTFTYPFAAGSQHCLLFPSAAGLEPSESCAPSRK
jgi:hypothetical protein